MKKIVLVLAALLFATYAQAQTIIAPPNVSLSGTVTAGDVIVGGPGATQVQDATSAPTINFGSVGLSLALMQGGLGNPGGTMANYVAGDTITLQCTGVTFSVSPVIGISTVSGGQVTSAIVVKPGTTSAMPPAGSASCSQLLTSGTGTGYTVVAKLGIIAAYLSVPTLSSGGGVSNGNLFINVGAADTPPSMGGPENTFIGDLAGFGFSGLAQANTALGHNSCGNGGSGVTGTVLTVCVGNDAGRNIQGSASNGNNTLVGGGAGRNIAGGWNTWIGSQAGGTNGVNTPGAVSGLNNVGVGYNVAIGITGGSGNLLLGAKAGSAITTGNNNIILGATQGGDNCANGNESNVVAVCPGAGRVLTITGGGTPSTSAASFAGTLAEVGITTDATHTDATVCEDTTTHQFYFGSGAAGICLGTSSARFKHDITDLADGLPELMKMRPRQYYLNEDHGGDPTKPLYGFVAEEAISTLPKLVGHDAEGHPNTFDLVGVVPVLVRGIQQMQEEIEQLKRKTAWIDALPPYSPVQDSLLRVMPLSLR